MFSTLLSMSRPWLRFRVWAGLRVQRLRFKFPLRAQMKQHDCQDGNRGMRRLVRHVKESQDLESRGHLNLIVLLHALGYVKPTLNPTP